MNQNSLHKVIKSFILPKYDWIVDFKIRMHLNAPREEYTVTYYVEPDEEGMFSVRDEMNEVDNLTLTMFRMVGANYNQILDDVFYVVAK